MPISDIEGLDKMVDSLGNIELKRLIRSGSVSESLDFEKKIWNIKVERKVLKLLNDSPKEVVNHFSKNTDIYQKKWIETVKENFDVVDIKVADIKEKSPSPNWRKNIKNEKNKNDNEQLK